MLDALLDAFLDSLRLIPFLFITYIFMELLEQRAGEKSRKVIEKADRVGPLWGALLGVIPQCGFSTVASNLYAGRVITMGTLLAIYLSTSDEMLPIFISSNVPVLTILKILGIKIVIAMAWGFLLELLLGKAKGKTVKTAENVYTEEECACCRPGVFSSAAYHTIKIFIYIVIFSILINLLIAFIGEATLRQVFTDTSILGELIAGLVGLIPNCASSVVITELYLQGIINAGSMMAGLLVNAGVGLLVLFRENESMKENITILGMLYTMGVISGVIIEILGIVF